jgi:hypothetical protein
MTHWATQLPAWFWAFVGFVLGFWAAYLISALVNLAPSPATHATIRQHGGSEMITGIVSGSTGKFSVTYNGALRGDSLPHWAASDPSIGLAVSPDGLTCDVAVPPGSGVAAFGLSAVAVASDGSSITVSATVPVLPPPPAPATAGVIDQIA